MDKLIITAAMVGAEVAKGDNRPCPSAPKRSRAAWECRQAGASIVHLHVRKPDGTPTQDAETFRRAIDLIEASCDVIVQVRPAEPWV